MSLPVRSEIRPGLTVQIVEKQNQRSGAVDGRRSSPAILTNSPSHPHGIKVMLEDGRVAGESDCDRRCLKSLPVLRLAVAVVAWCSSMRCSRRCAGRGGEVSVPARLLQEYALVEGASVTGPLAQGRSGSRAVRRHRGPRPAAGGLPRPDPLQPARRGRSDRALPPRRGRRHRHAPVDLLAPIGKGTARPDCLSAQGRQDDAAGADRAGYPQQRSGGAPDRAPDRRTSGGGDFFPAHRRGRGRASSSDRRLQEHLALAEWMLAHIRTELECGHDVVLLLDSLTRLSRSFNLRGSDRNRTLSGGLDAGALEIPAAFLSGLARNIENGGSVTILATLLVDTGSRLDQVIFEEFKGTGNCEIVLDRTLAEARIFPAVNPSSSGTRKEERLVQRRRDGASGLAAAHTLAGYPSRQALTHLLKLLAQYPTNTELLRHFRPAGSAGI